MYVRFGLNGTETDGIFFTESHAPPGTSILYDISVRRNRQNSNLGEVKTLMAAEARRVGANAVVRFKYGQRSHKWWEQMFTFRWDSESWFGEGQAVLLG
jgi:hypothetical protein